MVARRRRTQFASPRLIIVIARSKPELNKILCILTGFSGWRGLLQLSGCLQAVSDLRPSHNRTPTRDSGCSPAMQLRQSMNIAQIYIIIRFLAMHFSKINVATLAMELVEDDSLNFRHFGQSLVNLRSIFGPSIKFQSKPESM